MTEPQPSPHAPRPPARKASVVAAVAATALAKAKWAFVALKSLSLGKLLLTSGSMLAMIWFEAMRYGWAYGVGFVLLIFIHEMGHAVAIRHAGLAAGYPVFIPFFGAMISLKGQPRSPKEEARIALAGPIAGAAASAACAGIFLLTHQRLFLALAYGGFFLNLFNMIPMPPLDGGRAAAVFSKQAWWIGLVVLAGLFLVTRTPQLLLIGIFAAMNGFRSATHHVETTPEVRREVAASYFGLCVFLALGAHLTHQVLSE
ncbi:MAG TPA: site-2 protease family protein [Polyangiaceae bacterium]|nr:site-2 protease family protein [Polyangiaceae bacterium]